MPSFIDSMYAWQVLISVRTRACVPASKMIWIGRISLIVVSFMVELGDDGGEFREVVESKHDDPGFVVLTMADDRDFLYTGVGNRLFECLVKPEPFAPFALDMDVRDIRNDIRRIG